MPFESASIAFRHYRPADRSWVTAANARHYSTIEGFSVSFEVAVREALDLLELQLSDERSDFLIVEANERPVGCIFFSAESETRGRIRLFYLDEKYRGRSIGKRMLNRIIEHAGTMGFDKIHVATFDRHVDACRLYASLGFLSATREPSVAFGQAVRQVDFELPLRA